MFYENKRSFIKITVLIQLFYENTISFRKITVSIPLFYENKLSFSKITVFKSTIPTKISIIFVK